MTVTDPLVYPEPHLAAIVSTNDVVATTLPVDTSPQTWRTILRVSLPVAAGDLLDVSAWCKTMNDCGYDIGVGAHLWAYDLDNGGSSGTWWRLDPEAGSVGMNVTPDLHHLTLPVALPYLVPITWPPGHRIVVVLRADAHSTAARTGDVLTVEQVGRLTVRHYTQQGTPEA